MRKFCHQLGSNLVLSREKREIEKLNMKIRVSMAEAKAYFFRISRREMGRNIKTKLDVLPEKSELTI